MLLVLSAIMPLASSFAETPLLLRVGIYDNLILKDHRPRARSTLEQLTTFIGERLRVSTDLQIMSGGTREALIETKEALRTGRVHLVAMTGLEYGWLRELAGPDIEALVVANTDKNVVQYDRVIVRADSGKNLASLQSGSLATFDAPNPSMPIYLKQLRQKWGPSFLSESKGPYPTAASALQAVLTGKADAAIVDLYTTQGYERAYPGRMQRLKPIGLSHPYPMAPVVGIPLAVDSIRRELWRDTRAELAQVHRQPRAAAFLEVWRVSRFIPPSEKFESEADQAGKDFPLTDLNR
jgi:ABC-type phosphate/phosphonate transport system substrate-binding protein